MSGSKARSYLVSHLINDFLSINQAGNNSGALLLTVFELSNRRGNLAFTIWRGLSLLDREWT